MLDAFLDVPISVFLNLPLPLDRDVVSLVQPHIRLVLVSILKLLQNLLLLFELPLKLFLLPLHITNRNSSSSALLHLLVPDDSLR